MASADQQTVEEALELCLDDMEKGSALPLAEGVRSRIGAAGRPKFVANHDSWPRHQAKVRRAAMFIGRFAELFALFDGSPVVRDQDAARAVIVVKKLCDAPNERFAWCPDMPEP